jgi:putative ABC transport system permease protein
MTTMFRPEWWYRQLLRCFPFDFQRECGSEMSDVFSQQHREARRAGRVATMTLWAETVHGFLTTAPRQHLTMLVQDARYALRVMRRSPVFTGAAILALGLGIGANTAIFGVLNAMFVNPLPVREPSRLVSLFTTDQQTPGYTPISTHNFRDLRDQVGAFDGVAASSFAAVRLTGKGEPQELFAQVVSGNYFDVLGVQAALGRTFRPEEDITRGSHALVVLNDALWARVFGSDPAIVGRTIQLNNHPFTVLGVMPPRFRGTFALFASDLYFPLMMYDTPVPGTEWFESRRWRWLSVIARLRPVWTFARPRLLCPSYPLVTLRGG